MQYLIETPNPEYKGRTLGVQFARGRALLDPATIDPKLGLDVDEVADRMKKDFGYSVKLLETEVVEKKTRKPKVEVKVKAEGTVTSPSEAV